MGILSAKITIHGSLRTSPLAKIILAEAQATVHDNATELHANARAAFPPPRTVERITEQAKNKKGETTASGIKAEIIMVEGRQDTGHTFKVAVGGTNAVLTFIEYGTGRRGADDHNPAKNPVDIPHREDWPGMVAQPFLYPAVLKQRKPFLDSMLHNLRDVIAEWARRNHQ
jgi:hypothetical protein